MSHRNRLVLAALGLSAALFVSVPAPSPAAGPLQARLSTAGFAERLWSWLADLWPADESSGTPAWEKEGSAINPNGQPSPPATPTAPSGEDAPR